MDKLVQPPPYSERDPADNNGFTADIASISHTGQAFPASEQGSSQQINIHPFNPGYDVTGAPAQMTGSVSVVTVTTDTVHTSQRSCLDKMSLGLSISQLTMGIIFCISQLSQSIIGSALSIGQGGFIVGAVFTAAGIFGITAYRTGKGAYVAALLALSIGSLIASLVMMPVQLIDMLVTAILASHADRPHDWLKARIAINVVFIVGAFLQCIIALWASIVACKTICGCCATPALHNSMVAHYSNCSEGVVPQIQHPVIAEPMVLHVQPCRPEPGSSSGMVRPSAPSAMLQINDGMGKQPGSEMPYIN